MFNAYKAVATLPTPLAPNTIYLVRVREGFDLYCSDLTGTVAHKLNYLPESNIETIVAQKDLSFNDKKYQYLSSVSDQIVNLPSANAAPNKEFRLVNTGSSSALELRDNGQILDVYLDPSGIVDCHSNEAEWNIYIKY